MLTPSKTDSQKSLFFSLEDSLNQKHPLYILANKIDWATALTYYLQLRLLTSKG
jgi:hypothetical protein